jgi:4-amino-4-deoxy-L-arabinose transferase-like glycosyltransferase
VIAEHHPADRRGPAIRRRPFALPLAMTVVLGLIVRVVYIQFVAPHSVLMPDSGWYFWQAENLRHGLGYAYIPPPRFGVNIDRDFRAVNGHPTAFWPPGYPAFLVVVQIIFGSALRTSQLAGAATGGATIALTGLLGRAIAGRRVGLVAALLVALSPLVIATDGSLLADTLYLPLVLLALLLAHRARTRPTAQSWCALGAAIGVATLVRQDALLLIVFAAVPAAVLSRRPVRRLVPQLALGLGTLSLVLAPWVLRNAIVMHAATISTHSASTAIAGTNCALTYSGPELGWWDHRCTYPELESRMSEARYSSKITHLGVSYALAHSSRLPVVLSARFGRVWGLWNPVDTASRERIESRNFRWQMFAWAVSLCTLVLGLAGWRIMSMRGRPIALLVGQFAMTSVIAVGSYGNTRFRGPAECALAIGAAAAIVAATGKHPTSRPAPTVRAESARSAAEST